MGIVQRYLEQRATAKFLGPPSRLEGWLIHGGAGWGDTAGAQVTTESALSWTPLAAGIRVIAETMAQLPLQLLEALEPRGKKLRRDHRLWSLLHDAPNEEMTSFEWRELCQTWILLFGWAPNMIVYDGGGQVREIWPLSPDRVRKERDGRGKPIYRVTRPRDERGGVDGSVTLMPDEVLELRGFSTNGFMGRSMVEQHREAIGLGLVTEMFASGFFTHGINPAGIIERPLEAAELSKEAADRLRKSIEDVHKGLGKEHRAMILEEGMKWHQLTMEPEKAQFLGLRKFQVTEAARILRMPPHMLGDLERATFSNIEHQAIELVVYTLTPWAVRWEQRLRFSLLGRKDFNRLYPHFGIEGLLRGDTQARAQFYNTLFNIGVLSPNDVAELEDRNPIEGGDQRFVPLNMVPLTQAGQVTIEERMRALALAQAMGLGDRPALPAGTTGGGT